MERFLYLGLNLVKKAAPETDWNHKMGNISHIFYGHPNAGDLARYSPNQNLQGQGHYALTSTLEIIAAFLDGPVFDKKYSQHGHLCFQDVIQAFMDSIAILLLNLVRLPIFKRNPEEPFEDDYSLVCINSIKLVSIFCKYGMFKL